MKVLQLIISFLIVSIFENCSTTAQVSGRYSNVYAEIAGVEFKFTQAPNTFEYRATTEGMVRLFSLGTWKQNKGTILLNGFDENINVLNVESKTGDYSDHNVNKIVVKYRDNPLDTFTKVDLIVNGSYKVRIPGDTAFYTNRIINSLRVKSYLVHEGFSLGAPHQLDTLCSTEIKIGNANGKIVWLKFDVAQNDFYRTRLTDTLTVRNNRTLLWHKKEFKKIGE
jgi:hypothetical protein